MKQNLQEISHSPSRTLTTHKITQVEALEGNKGVMKLKDRVGRGIYRVGKDVGTVVIVLQSSERLCTMRSFCEVFGQYLVVQKLVNERSSDPSTSVQCNFGLTP